MKRILETNVMLSPINDPFDMEPRSIALIVVDVQYATAYRTTGMGKAAIELGKESVLDYRFSRIEKVAVPNIRKLLDFFRKNNLRIVYLTTGSEMPDYSDCLPHRRRAYKPRNNTKGNREHEILDEIKPIPGECVINKTTSSAFNSTNIDMILSKGMGIECLLFTGVSTDNCVENTARDAVDRGFQCIMVEDGCASFDEVFHDAALRHFCERSGRVETTEDIIEEISRALTS